MSYDAKQAHAERLSAIAERAFEREQQIAPTPFSINRIQTQEVKVEKTNKTEKVAKTTKKVDKEITSKPQKTTSLREEVQVVFKKALTDREQKVFDHFARHKGETVYAKDLAQLLDLPRDYVYKYIKNLRAKIEGDKLENSDKGGFILNI